MVQYRRHCPIHPTNPAAAAVEAVMNQSEQRFVEENKSVVDRVEVGFVAESWNRHGGLTTTTRQMVRLMFPRGTATKTAGFVLKRICKMVGPDVVHRALASAIAECIVNNAINNESSSSSSLSSLVFVVY
jgi:hypothetical protein